MKVVMLADVNGDVQARVLVMSTKFDLPYRAYCRDAIIYTCA